tara:strand:+ start:586 stop:732 length:147 start_codon:yes stop_codon:yes gene_type:complete
MELFGFNEYQWLTITICAAGICYTLGKRMGMSNTLDYLRDKGLIDYDD